MAIIRKHSQYKKIFIILAVFILLGGLLFALEKTNVTNLYTKKPAEPTNDEKTTSITPTAQEDYNEGNEREPGNTLKENAGNGGIIDNNGSVGNNVDISNPVVSSSGEISVYTPRADSVISSGIEVSGASTLDTVSYRIVDSVSGVIASGNLSVVNGKFSGKLSYSTNAPSGRLDIFGTRSDGVEFGNIELNVRFKN